MDYPGRVPAVRVAGAASAGLAVRKRVAGADAGAAVGSRRDARDTVGAARRAKILLRNDMDRAGSVVGVIFAIVHRVGAHGAHVIGSE